MGQQQVARCLGVSQSKVSAVERGSSRLAADDLSKLATLFAVPVWAFFDEMNAGASLGNDLRETILQKAAAGSADHRRAVELVLGLIDQILDPRLTVKPEGS